MIINRKSAATGIRRRREIKCDPKDYEMWEKGYLNIQDAMGYLKQEDRDFILSGITSDEWNNMWKNEIENIVMDHV
jgi:hypothetical protein